MGHPRATPVVTKIVLHQTDDTIEQFGQLVTLDAPAVTVHVRGGFVLVDEQDVPILYRRRWNVQRHRRTAYCVYHGSCEALRLHRLIVPQFRGIDHENRVGWDNRRCNLREADDTGNARNHAAHTTKIHSRFKGVSYDARKGLYRARIMVDGKSIGLGRFKSEVDAAKAYDEAARRYHGEFACTNFEQGDFGGPERL